MPIMLCKHKIGKVASEIANLTYSASKKMYYYGIKLHCLGQRRIGQLPLPRFVTFTEASCHDSIPFKEILPNLNNCFIFADKAYFGEETSSTLEKQESLLLIPNKKTKGESLEETQRNQAHNDLWGKAVSSVRQPIEAFFNWIIQKTNIQDASKVRSTKGLLVHVYGIIIATSLLTLNF